jgi:MoxR-like ATPase
MVKRHKDCIITATGNTWGLGATLEFSGATKLDEAFLSRFEIKLPWDVDTTFERKLVGNADWHDYVQTARQRIRDAGIKYTIDSRAAIAGARMISQLGYTFEQAARQTYLASLKPDQRSIVQGLSA